MSGAGPIRPRGGPGFGPVTGAGAICALLWAGAGLAEVADGPFLRCSFDDGRVVVLAKAGAGFEWREGVFTAPLIAEPQTTHDPTLSFWGNWDDPERIDVFYGWVVPDPRPAVRGMAQLSRSVITADGQFATLSVHGTCEDFFG